MDLWWPYAAFPSLDPTKYFGCELGAQTQFDVKNDRYIVNGSHEANKLQDMLDGFIKKFVLCPECENPETDLVSCMYDSSWGCLSKMPPNAVKLKIWIAYSAAVLVGECCSVMQVYAMPQLQSV